MTVPNFEFDGEPILPDRQGYTLPVSFGAIVSEIKGGPVRSKSVSRNNGISVVANYTMTLQQARYFINLYYNVLNEGQLPLRVMLEATGSDINEQVWYTATIVQPPAFPSYLGHTNTLRIVFDIVPQINKPLSCSRALIYETFGEYPELINTALDPLGALR